VAEAVNGRREFQNQHRVVRGHVVVDNPLTDEQRCIANQVQATFHDRGLSRFEDHRRFDLPQLGFELKVVPAVERRKGFQPVEYRLLFRRDELNERQKVLLEIEPAVGGFLDVVGADSLDVTVLLDHDVGVQGLNRRVQDPVFQFRVDLPVMQAELHGIDDARYVRDTNQCENVVPVVLEKCGDVRFDDVGIEVDFGFQHRFQLEYALVILQ